MKSYKFEKFLDNNNIRFTQDNFPDIFHTLGVTDVYYLPDQKVIIDLQNRLSEEVSTQLEIAGYPVFLLDRYEDLFFMLDQNVSSR